MSIRSDQTTKNWRDIKRIEEGFLSLDGTNILENSPRRVVGQIMGIN